MPILNKRMLMVKSDISSPNPIINYYYYCYYAIIIILLKIHDIDFKYMASARLLSDKVYYGRFKK